MLQPYEYHLSFQLPTGALPLAPDDSLEADLQEAIRHVGKVQDLVEALAFAREAAYHKTELGSEAKHVTMQELCDLMDLRALIIHAMVKLDGLRKNIERRKEGSG